MKLGKPIESEIRSKLEMGDDSTELLKGRTSVEIQEKLPGNSINGVKNSIIKALNKLRSNRT